MSAPLEELEKVPGVGENAALLLRLIPQVERRMAAGPRGKTVILNTPEKIGNYLLGQYRGEIGEVVLQLCLDQKGKLLICCRVSEGGGSSADFNLRTVLMNALRCGASMVVLAHNHPSGVALPSEAALIATRQVQQALETVGIRLLDHMVVADGDYVSMAQNGTLRERAL